MENGDFPPWRWWPSIIIAKSFLPGRVAMPSMWRCLASLPPCWQNIHSRRLAVSTPFLVVWGFGVGLGINGHWRCLSRDGCLAIPHQLWLVPPHISLHPQQRCQSNSGLFWRWAEPCRVTFEEILLPKKPFFSINPILVPKVHVKT